MRPTSCLPNKLALLTGFALSLAVLILPTSAATTNQIIVTVDESSIVDADSSVLRIVTRGELFPVSPDSTAASARPGWIAVELSIGGQTTIGRISQKDVRYIVPAKAVRAQAQTLFDQVYKARYEQAIKLRGPQKAAALKKLAEELYALQPDEKDPATRFVLLDNAMRWSTESGDPTLTTQIIDDLADQFDVDDLLIRAGAVKAWVKLIEKNYRRTELLQKRGQLLDLIVPLAARADRAQRYVEAADLYDLAGDQAGGDLARQRELRKLRQVAKVKVARRESMLKLAKELETTDDARKHLTLGMYWSVEVDDWPKGLPHLSRGSDPALSQAASFDLAGGNTIEACIAIGDSWWSLAQASKGALQKALFRRMQYWYEPVADQLTGLSKGQVEHRMQAAIDAIWDGLPPRTTNSIGMQLKLIPAGEFIMGSPPDEPGRKEGDLQHPVRLTKPFYMGVFEVTQEQYMKVIGENPSQFKGPTNPVEMVSWNDAVGFCQKLSGLPAERFAERTYRLPTEAEWEYACRAGTAGAFSCGAESQLGYHGWFDSNAEGSTHPVGQRKPNPWGLFDMHGNVLEWCHDWYAAAYSSGAVSDPQGPSGSSTGVYRVSRGGYWNSPASDCRSADHDGHEPGTRRNSLGFRVVAVPSDR